MQLSDEQQAQNSSKENILESTDIAANEVAKVDTIDDLEENCKTNVANNLWEYEDILKILGFGKTQWILLLISGLMTLTSVASQLSLGIIAISSKCEFNMSQRDMGIMMTARVAGIILSTYIWGYISDILGRRTVLLWTMFTTNILQFILMFVTNVWQFSIVNLIMGISLGGISGAIYPYLGEFNTAKNRPIVINYSVMFLSVTNIYVPAISWLLLSFEWSLEIYESFIFKPWRLIILFSLLPGLIGALLLLSFPESPKLLLAHNKPNEALKALNWISKYNKGLQLADVLNSTTISLKPQELAAADMLTLGQGCSIIPKIWQATKPLFYKPHGLNVILAVSVLFGMFCSGGLQNWFSVIINRTTRTGQFSEAATLCEILKESYKREGFNTTLEKEGLESRICDDTIATKTFIDNIIMGFGFVLGFSVQGALINPLGRKNILLASSALSALCSILLYMVNTTSGILFLLSLCVLLPGLSISIMCGAMVDLVPTHFRGKAVSLGLTLGRIGLIISSNLVAVMLESYCNGLFGIITSTFLVCGGLIYFLPI